MSARSHRLALSEKVAIIKGLDQGSSTQRLAKIYGVTPSAITYTWRKRAVILPAFVDEEIGIRRRVTRSRSSHCPNSASTHDRVNKAVYEWYLMKMSRRRSISKMEIQAKAREIAKDLNRNKHAPNFVFNAGERWFKKWKRDYDVEEGEKGSDPGLRSSSYEDQMHYINKTVFEWFQDAKRRKSRVPRRADIQAKAKKVAVAAGLTIPFKGSRHWYDRWKAKYRSLESETSTSRRSSRRSLTRSRKSRVVETKENENPATVSGSIASGLEPPASGKTMRTPKGDLRYDYTGEIEMLLGMRKTPDGIYYLAKFKNQDDTLNRWERKELLERKLIEDYKEMIAKVFETKRKFRTLVAEENPQVLICRSGYSRGLELERILGIAKIQGNHCFIVKFKGKEEFEMVPAAVVSTMNTQEVITFYENRMVLKNGRDGGQYAANGLDLVGVD